MKFTEEDREIVARVKRNVPFILAVVASAPLFFLALTSAISGSYISSPWPGIFCAGVSQRAQMAKIKECRCSYFLFGVGRPLFLPAT